MNIIGEINVISDTHGANGAINYWIRNSNVPNLIHCGDDPAGFQGYESKLIELGDKLNKTSKRIYVIQGNHCDPSYYDNRIYGGEWGGIQLLKNGTIAEWNGEKILFVGGATSIDRTSRVQGIDYWEDEIFEPYYPNQDIKIDHLVTHTSIPEVTGMSIYGPNVLGWATRDGDLIHDLMMEAQIVKNWVDGLLEAGHPLKTWHYGHFHKSILSEYKGIRCRCLDINEIAPFGRQKYFL